MEFSLHAGQVALAALALLVTCALAARGASLRRPRIYNSEHAATINGRRADGRA
jgi:hypothetical protein